MLILSRKSGEKVNIYDENDKLILTFSTIFSKYKSQIKIHFDADKKYTILREEIPYNKKAS